MRKGVWLAIGLVFVVLVTALLAANREDVVYYVRLAGAYLTGRRFYANYAHLERDIAFHPEMDPRLDVYSPAEGADHPVLVFFHGGGWTKYDKVLFAPVAGLAAGQIFRWCVRGASDFVGPRVDHRPLAYFVAVVTVLGGAVGIVIGLTGEYGFLGLSVGLVLGTLLGGLLAWGGMILTI